MLHRTATSTGFCIARLSISAAGFGLSNRSRRDLATADRWFEYAPDCIHDVRSWVGTKQFEQRLAR